MGEKQPRRPFWCGPGFNPSLFSDRRVEGRDLSHPQLLINCFVFAPPHHGISLQQRCGPGRISARRSNMNCKKLLREEPRWKVYKTRSPTRAVFSPRPSARKSHSTLFPTIALWLFSNRPAEEEALEDEVPVHRGATSRTACRWLLVKRSTNERPHPDAGKRQQT